MQWRDWLTSAQSLLRRDSGVRTVDDSQSRQSSGEPAALGMNEPTMIECPSDPMLADSETQLEDSISADDQEKLNRDITALYTTDRSDDADDAEQSAASDADADTSRVTVPGYDILGELGRGGMGVVYRARHQRLQREVALKMILAGSHASKRSLARFRAEAEAVAQLQHPNIVQVFEIGEHEGCPFFSLELVEGGGLDELLRESPPTPRAAAQLTETLARAIGFAHQRGIIHRDIKPANILLGTSDSNATQEFIGQPSGVSGASYSGGDWSQAVSPKITDFGLAKRTDDESGITHTGTILGSPSYMSPEQASGNVRELGPATDIYALGVVLYEMLVGRCPFRAGRVVEVIRQVIEAEPVPPRQLEPRVPLDVETICLKCLEKQPERRYLTAEELADDLHRFLVGKPILARPVSLAERAWKWAKRRPSTVALLAMTLAAIIGSVMFMVWHNVSLSEQLDQALTEQREAHRRETDAIDAREQQEKDAAEARRQSEIRNAAQQQFDGARVAVAAGDLANAQIELTKALTVLRREPQLADLRNPAEALLKNVEHELAIAADQVASQERFAKFGQLRDEAQFLGSLYTGMDLAANLKAARAAVQAALAVYEVKVVDPQDAARPPAQEAAFAPDPHLTDAQRAEIQGDCYQLLLILAETQAQSAMDLQPVENERQLRDALRVLDRAVKFGAPSRAWHLRQARYLRLLDDVEGAARAEHDAKVAVAAGVFDQFLMADEFYRRAEFDDAIREFENVLQAKPDHFWAQYLSGLCLLRQNRHSEARSHLTACLAQGREFVWLYLLRGFANGELLAFDAANADFDKALTLPLDDNSRYVLFVNRGVLRIRQKRFHDAITDLNAAVKLKPDGYQAFVNLAQAYRQLKDLDGALGQLNSAIKLEPTVAHLYRLRARLRVERDDPDMARTDFQQVIQLEDADSPFLQDDHVEYGRLLLRAGEHEPALVSFTAALKLKADHSLARRLQAETLFHLGRFKEVIESFDGYLETGQPLESVYRGRGLAKSELGHFPGAIEDFTKALELQPTSAVQAYRGWMHVVVDAKKLAERDFELAIELDPKNGDAFNGRGFVRAVRGAFSEAIEDAEQAVSLGPPSARLYYNAARIHALTPTQSPRVFELITESMNLLPAGQRASFWTNQVGTDTSLNTIRRHPMYLELELKFGAEGTGEK